MKKRNLEFDVERHRYVKDHLKLERMLRTFVAMGFLKSRKHPVTGQLQFCITEKGRRERKVVLN
jgi:hypothetical protein